MEISFSDQDLNSLYYFELTRISVFFFRTPPNPAYPHPATALCCLLFIRVPHPANVHRLSPLVCRRLLTLPTRALCRLSVDDLCSHPHFPLLRYLTSFPPSFRLSNHLILNYLRIYLVLPLFLYPELPP